MAVMLQRWHEISFFHWSSEPELIKPKLPDRLEVDTHNGKAWISLTPFLLTGLRPPLVPHAFGLTFPEMNLRTYVLGPRGPGIWFFSLDAKRRLAVLGARATYGLPYFKANMRVDIGALENAYTSERGEAKARVRIAKGDRIDKPSALDLFLTARFRLYSMRRGRLITAEVSHAPWVLNRVKVVQLEETVRRTMAVEFSSSDFLSHHSYGVDTRIGRPQRV